MKKAKIGILTSVHNVFDNRIFNKEATSLVSAGYDVILIAQHHKEETVAGVKIIPLPKPRNRVERMIRTVLQLYRNALKIDADLYHFHDPELIPIGLKLKRRGKKVIYDVHEDVPRQIMSKHYFPFILRKPISGIIAAIEAFSSQCFDSVITATPFINKRFLRFGVNAVNVNNYPLLSELYPGDEQWDKKEKSVCYIGGISKIRGMYQMAEAICKTDYNLLLAGALNPDIENILDQGQCRKQIEVLGYIDREGIRITTSRSMAGLVLFHPEPNHINAQPNKIFEYMSAGIPVLASNFPLWKEILEDTNCGICVDPFNTDQIAKAIKWIIEHPIEAQRMGENGLRAVGSKYNWGKEKKKLLQLYHEMCQ